MRRALTSLKRIVAVLVIFCLMFSLIPASAFAVTASDISGHWAQVKIQSWMDKGLIKGYPDGTFKPDQHVTRAEFMTLANRAFGYTAVVPITYTDVKAGSWYAPEVAKAKAAGYISGYPDGTMKPENPITREEVATIVARIKNLTSDANAADKYTDASKIGSWSKGQVGAVTSAKIMQGYPDGSFMPQGLMTRAEVVVASDNALHYTAPVANIAVSAITITPTTMALTAGGATGAITATVSPSNATNKIVTWSSSKAAVATVAGGVVTPVAAGAAVITATTVDGSFTATCTVTVTPPVVSGGSTPPPPVVSGGSTPPPLTVVRPITSADVAVTQGSIDFLFSFVSGSTPITFAQAQADLYCLDPIYSTVQLRAGSSDSSPVSSKVKLSDLPISDVAKLSYATFGSLVAAFGNIQNVPTDIRLYLSCGVDPTISNPWTYDTGWIHFSPEEQNVFALYGDVYSLLIKNSSGVPISGDALASITNKLTLDSTGTFGGSTITWASSNSGVIATDGTVTRPAFGAGNAIVTLTATITKGTLSPETKVFTLTVLAQTLAAAKTTAHGVLTAALGTYTQGNYTTANWTTLTGFKTAGDTAIDAATGTAGVTSAQTTATAGMAGVQTIAQTLAAAKTTAHGVLTAALGTYTQGNYTTANWTTLTGFKTAGDTAIDAATGTAGVTSAQTTATAGMAGVATIAEADAAATAAVVTAETTPTQENIDAAQALVTALPDGALKTALQARLSAIVLGSPTLTIWDQNLNVAYDTYPANTIFQANVNLIGGFTLPDFSSVVIRLYNGTTLLATNSAKPALLAQALAGVTDIFGIGDAADPTADPNWIIGAYSPSLAPTSATFTLTTTDGAVYTATATLDAGSAAVLAADAAATAAVVTAETTPTQENIDAAQALVTALPDGALKTALQARLSAIVLGSPTLTIWDQNLNVAYDTYPANTIFQANVNLIGGFTLPDFSSVVIRLYNGTTLLATNSAKPALLAQALAGVTDIFGIGDAADPTADPNWIIGAYSPSLAPTSATFTLTTTDGAVYTATATLDAGSAAVLAADAAATAAVVTAETTPTQENIDAAQALVTALPTGTLKTALQDRINAVQVIVTLAAAKVTALDDLAAAFDDYAVTDYTTANWTTLTGFDTAGITNIGDATDLTGVSSALSAATGGMDAVETKAETLAATKATAADFFAGEITAANVGSALANGPETINTGATQSAVADGVITVTGAIRAKGSNQGTFEGSAAGPAIAQYLLIPAGSASVEEFRIVNEVPSSLGIALLNNNPGNPDAGWFDYTKGVFRMGVYLYSVDGLRAGDLPLEFVFKDAAGTVLKDIKYTLRFQTTAAIVATKATAADFFAGEITAANVGSALANGPETINTGATQSAVADGVITVTGAIRAKGSNQGTFEGSAAGPAIAQYLLIPAGSASVEEFRIVNEVPSSLGIALLNNNPGNPDAGWFDYTKGVFRMGVYLYSVDGLRAGDLPLEFVFKDAAGTVLKDIKYTLRFQTTPVTPVTPVTPEAPSVTAEDTTNAITGLGTTMEFKVDGADYVKYDGSNAPNLAGVHTVLVRVAKNLATDTPASADTTLTFTAN